MRILLIGDDTKSIDLPSERGDLSARWNAELMPAILANRRFCIFDRQQSIDPRENDAVHWHQFDAAGAAALIVPYSGGEWLQIVRELPVRIQSLVPNLSFGGAVAIPTDRLSGVLPFQDTTDPVQDALIRLIVETPESHIQYSELTLPAGDLALSFPELAPGISPGATPQMTQHLSRFVPEEVAPVESASDAVALIAGLYLIHDCLDRSHSLSQDVQGQGPHASGDYWHAIMHRREPDYGNSKYWYRHVGSHPISSDLAQQAAVEFESAEHNEAGLWSERICGRGEWNPFAWVDFCEHVEQGEDSALYVVAQRLQWIEMLLLLRQTAEDAYGSI